MCLVDNASHALDQLLLGLVENQAVSMAEIARIGSRSQEEALEEVGQLGLRHCALVYWQGPPCLLVFQRLR